MDAPPQGRVELLYHFCRLQLPALTLTADHSRQHLERVFELHATKDPTTTWETFLDNLYPLDWFVASGVGAVMSVLPCRLKVP